MRLGRSIVVIIVAGAVLLAFASKALADSDWIDISKLTEHAPPPIHAAL